MFEPQLTAGIIFAPVPAPPFDEVLADAFALVVPPVLRFPGGSCESLPPQALLVLRQAMMMLVTYSWVLSHQRLVRFPFRLMRQLL